MIKKFIDYLKDNNISKDNTLKLLKEEKSLSSDEKNLIFAYCFPRQLLDRELPIRIKNYREKSGYSGLNVDPHEVALIIEAGQTEQYRRYIKHLMHSFSDVSNINPVNSSEEGNPRCGICDNELLYFKDWEEYAKNINGELENRECLAFGSTESGIVLCKHCLLQLVNAVQVMNDLDPSYLDWTKRRM